MPRYDFLWNLSANACLSAEISQFKSLARIELVLDDFGTINKKRRYMSRNSPMCYK